MHDWIDGQVVEDDGDGAAMRRVESLSALAMRRTWAFPLHDADALDGLKEAIKASLP